MSNYKGQVLCHNCGSYSFRINHWETYFSVICTDCGTKYGEVDIDSWVVDRIRVVPEEY